jgi:hypothetical protein
VRGNQAVISLLAFSVALGGASSTARADGGTVRYSGRCGDRLVTIFTDPTPPRAGVVDVSVLVQDAESKKPMTNVPVVVRAHRIDGAPVQLRARATGEAATNKLLRAAPLELTAGRWHNEILVDDSAEGSPIAFDLDVTEGLPAWTQTSLWIGWPFAVIGLFVAHQCLILMRRSPQVESSRSSVV